MPITLLSAAIDLTAVRLFLHLLGVAGWVGGQVLMLALLPVLRSSRPELPRLAVRRFAQMAWPCLVLTIATGLWGLLEAELSGRDSEYLSTLLIKLLLVAVSGLAAFIHSASQSHSVRGISGALGFLGALGALFFGAALGP